MKKHILCLGDSNTHGYCADPADCADGGIRFNEEAPWLERILAGSNVDDYESLQYFQRQLGESGILDALVEKGVEENDTVLIGEYQFDYIF